MQEIDVYVTFLSLQKRCEANILAESSNIKASEVENIHLHQLYTVCSEILFKLILDDQQTCLYNDVIIANDFKYINKIHVHLWHYINNL